LILNSYSIIRSDTKDLDRIKPLWEKLNRVHQENSPYFRKRYENMNWEKRRNSIIEKSSDVMLDYAIDKDEIIGYCISTIEKHDPWVGEIDSILVDERCRKTGLGCMLMERAIQWLDSKKVKTKKLMVSVGNEKVLDFYSQFDFYPLHIILHSIEK